MDEEGGCEQVVEWAQERGVEGAFGGNGAEADGGGPFIPRGWLGSGSRSIKMKP